MREICSYRGDYYGHVRGYQMDVRAVRAVRGVRGEGYVFVNCVF
jgi:hypothetical protein